MSLGSILAVGLAFAVIFPLGYGLTRSGKPYNSVLFNVHKLMGLGVLVYLVVLMVRANRAIGLTGVTVAAGVVTGVLFVVLGGTGGALSAAEKVPAIVRLVHHVAPYLAVASTAVTLYLLLGRG